MALKSLNQLRKYRNRLLGWRTWWLQNRLGMQVGEGASISLASRFVTHQRGDISIGDYTLVAFKTLFLTRDAHSRQVRPIRIGRHCFIGGGSVIMPGVTIGDESIVGGGSVVFDDVPARAIVVGNPARVVRRDIEVGRFGRLSVADDNSRRMYQL